MALQFRHIILYLKNSIYVFLLLCALSIPFTWSLFPWHEKLTSAIYFYPVMGLSDLLNYSISLEDFSSDTRALVLLFSFNLLLSFLLSVLFFRMRLMERIHKIVPVILSYYLALILLKYGFDKLFKAQFYLPEPNLLYTPLGKLDRDILYWSTMGSSRSYNIFMGLAEIIPGLLILYHKTRLLGLIISLGVLINVIAVNFSFDISVKFFSCFLLLINILLLMPYLRFLWNALIIQQPQPNDLHLKLGPRRSWRNLKLLVLIFISIEVLFPYLSTSNFNDDRARRPYLHGAYENLDSNSETKRVFVHRNGYLIFQDQNDNFTDYQLKIDRLRGRFILTDYNLNSVEIPYRFNPKTRTLKLLQAGMPAQAFKSLEWRNLPLLKGTWHLTVD